MSVRLGGVAKILPKEEFQREVEKELTGKNSDVQVCVQFVER